MNKKIHSIFPTLIYEDYYHDNDKFLDILSESWESHFTDGYTGELNGNLDLHLDEKYFDLYKFLHGCVEKYLENLGIDRANFNINFVKSWMNVLQHSKTPMHSHRDAHISIVYYANTPLNLNQYIRFRCDDYFREPFDGIFNFNSSGDTDFNSKHYLIKPKRGQSLVFSAKIAHDTISDNTNQVFLDAPVSSLQDLQNRRICIASDIVLTYKTKTSKSLGLQPVSNWRNFE